VLHRWLKAELRTILAKPEGLTVRTSLPQELPPLRMLLIWDTLTGHYTVDFVLWLFEHGIMPLFTPLGGSYLNMAESIQRVLKRRALEDRTASRGRLSGMANGGPDGSEHASDDLRWVAQALRLSTAPSTTDSVIKWL
jgi:hypothetical protein